MSNRLRQRRLGVANQSTFVYIALTATVLAHLSKGQQVIVAEMSHHDLPGTNQPQAIERLLMSFYDTGVGDNSLYTYAPLDFQVSWGYPVLAKIGLYRDHPKSGQLSC